MTDDPKCSDFDTKGWKEITFLTFLILFHLEMFFTTKALSHQPFGVAQALKLIFAFFISVFFRGKLLSWYVVNNIITDLHMENVCDLVRAWRKFAWKSIHTLDCDELFHAPCATFNTTKRLVVQLTSKLWCLSLMLFPHFLLSFFMNDDDYVGND